MKLLQYSKCLKELELYIEADSILNICDKDIASFHPEHNIPLEDMSKLDKFRILKELEDEEDSIISEVEELK